MKGVILRKRLTWEKGNFFIARYASSKGETVNPLPWVLYIETLNFTPSEREEGIETWLKHSGFDRLEGAMYCSILGWGRFWLDVLV